MYQIAMLIITGTSYCYLLLLPLNEIKTKSKSLLNKANKGELPNKSFNDRLLVSESKHVDLVTIPTPHKDKDEAIVWFKQYIDEHYPGDKQQLVTNYNECYHQQVTTLLMIKHTEDPGFVVIITQHYDKLSADRNITQQWYQKLGEKLPRLAGMIQRSGVDEMYHQVLLSGDKISCVNKATELLNKYVDDIRCLNYTF